MFRNYFATHKDSLDPIEGVWKVTTTQEFYRYDTLYDVVKFPKPLMVAVIRKDTIFNSYNLEGASYDVEFQPTDVEGVYLYRNYFPITNQYSKAQAVITQEGVMQYTYDFPDEYLRLKLADTYETGTRVVNIIKWVKVNQKN